MKLYALDVRHTDGKITPLFRRENLAALETTALRLSQEPMLQPLLRALDAFTVTDNRGEVVFSVIVAPVRVTEIDHAVR